MRSQTPSWIWERGRKKGVREGERERKEKGEKWEGKVGRGSGKENACVPLCRVTLPVSCHANSER